MKPNRTNIFIAVSSVALIIVLIIQVNWILQTARIKEDLFNERANMVLSRTAEVLSSDKETCKKIEACVELDAPTLGRAETYKIDSLLKHYMDLYKIHIDYTFKIIKPVITTQSQSSLTSVFYPDRPHINKRGFREVFSENGLELNIVFPEKSQFIIAEMGTLFISSVILILIVLVLFWRTVVSLIKEKEISEHTTDFLNNMTHEFKTPLTNIALAGKMISKDPTLKQEDRIKHYSGIILEENDKLKLQVEQVLSMTALERGEIPLQKTELDLHQLIHDSLKCISVQIENQQGNIKLRLEAGNTVVMGDKSHLTNTLCNLIDNAIKYSYEKPELTIQTFNSDQKFVVVVSDKGIGISKAYQQKVFEKFFRVPTGNIHDVKGFGLGLAYVKKIIELHKGSIELRSEKGNGTSFIITLPNA
jgi:two-component system phosphate regulon sensor histidine kinase PhoR